SSGCYRTSGHALNLFRQMNCLRLALERGEVPPITVPGETIPVHSCPPGWADIGGVCWPPPMTEPPSGGGGGPGMPGGPKGDGRHGPGGESGGESPEPQSTDKYKRRVRAVGDAWRKQCDEQAKGDEYEAQLCCNKKEDTCIIQY